MFVYKTNVFDQAIENVFEINLNETQCYLLLTNLRLV